MGNKEAKRVLELLLYARDVYETLWGCPSCEEKLITYDIDGNPILYLICSSERTVYTNYSIEPSLFCQFSFLEASDSPPSKVLPCYSERDEVREQLTRLIGEEHTNILMSASFVDTANIMKDLERMKREIKKMMRNDVLYGPLSMHGTMSVEMTPYGRSVIEDLMKETKND